MAAGLYLPRDSGLHRLHPLTKLVLAGSLLVGGLALPEPGWTYGLLAAGILPLAAWGRVAAPLAGVVWRAALPFAISILLVQGFFWPGGTPLLSLGPLALKQEGVDFAVISVSRILIVVSAFTLLALTTRPDALMGALTQRGLPGGLAYILVATLQLVPRLQAKARAIVDAQHARGLETRGSLRQRLRALMPLVVPLVLSSLLDVEERAMALEARAFNRAGPKTVLLQLPEAGWEPAARWALALGALSLVGLRLWLAVGGRS